MPGTPRSRRFPLPLARVHDSPVTGAARQPLRPQRPLREAHESAARRLAPAGLGLDSAQVRLQMVAQLQAQLEAHGVAHAAVLEAFRAVERHRFVDSGLAHQAYEDTALPIGLEQTISKPSVVARMLALLCERVPPHMPLSRVLEIGSGCGYQAALLARLARKVVSIERIGELARRAHALLAEMGVSNVELVHGDGIVGHAASAPYDGIISAAGGSVVPQAWLDQLAHGGRLVTPWHDPERGAQVLLVVDRQGGTFKRQVLDAVHFVPLKSGAA